MPGVKKRTREGVKKSYGASNTIGILLYPSVTWLGRRGEDADLPERPHAVFEL